MAKYRRKIYQTQRDKVAISVAKKLKERGILSPQAKLHGGRYISPDVLRKVREYQASANLGYKAHKVPRAVAKAAKERGYQVVRGNRIVGPAERTFSSRLKQGLLTGVRPVKGGMMEEVTLPHTVFDLHTLIDQLGEGIDSLKNPDEQFAFTFHGNKSLTAFQDSRALLERMMHYHQRFETANLDADEMQEEFNAFVIFRLHREDVPGMIPTPAQRERMRPRTSTTGRTYNAPTMSERLAKMHPDRAARMRKKLAERDRAKREAIKADPKRYEQDRAKSRARAKASYERKKKK